MPPTPKGLHKKAPVIEASRLTPPNANGWNNTDVATHVEATDALSGVDGTATADVVITAEGANQPRVSGNAQLPISRWPLFQPG